ncbi:MAG: HAD family hydrolase [Hyalangium sp.]|uniref:HAD family hydrolase n=1 Tax=Hyalangium sp. TaxID=2028555 RepID=UPI00389ACA5F
MPLRAALFDLDGTLVDSLADIAAAMNHSLAEHGLPTHPVAAYRHYVGEGVVVLVRKAIPAKRAELQASVLAAYRAYYEEHLFDHTQVFPGLPDVLEQIAADGVRLAVLSNKADAFTRRLVQGLLPGVPFAAVYGERSGVPRKPDPTAALGVASELGVAPANCAFVGDTAVDMNTARSAGMYGVGVTWGFRSADELRIHGARALATTSDELLSILRSA